MKKQKRKSHLKQPKAKVLSFPVKKLPKPSATGNSVPIRIELPSETDRQNRTVENYYLLNSQGVFFCQATEYSSGTKVQKTCIAIRPIWIERKLVDPREGVEFLELAWHCPDDQIRKVVVSRDALGDRRKLLALSEFASFPVDISNAKELARYLQAVEKYAPKSLCSRTCGWISDKKFSPYDVELIPDTGLEQFKDAFSKKGSLEAQLELLSQLRSHPWALFYVIAGLTAPVLRKVGAPSFVVDLSGRSSRGKTTALKVAASLWGNPEELIVRWNATRVFLEKITAFFNDTPVFLDDSQEASKETLQKTLYAVANETGRGRATATGVQRLRKWKTVFLSTGEAPVFENCNWAGARVRTISITESPFRQMNHAEFLDFEDKILHNCGHLAPVFVKEVVSYNPEKLRKRYLDILKSLGSLESEYQQRLARYYATILLTSKIVDYLFNLETERVISSLKGSVVSDGYVKVEEEVLETFTGWLFENGYKILPDCKEPVFGRMKDEERNVLIGFEKEDEICILPTALKNFLKQHNYPYAIVRLWIERGVLVKSSAPDRFTVQRKLKNKPVWVYAFNKDALEPAPDEETLPF